MVKNVDVTEYPGVSMAYATLRNHLVVWLWCCLFTSLHSLCGVLQHRHVSSMSLCPNFQSPSCIYQWPHLLDPLFCASLYSGLSQCVLYSKIQKI